MDKNQLTIIEIDRSQVWFWLFLTDCSAQQSLSCVEWPDGDGRPTGSMLRMVKGVSNGEVAMRQQKHMVGNFKLNWKIRKWGQFIKHDLPNAVVHVYLCHMRILLRNQFTWSGSKVLPQTQELKQSLLCPVWKQTKEKLGLKNTPIWTDLYKIPTLWKATSVSIRPVIQQHLM